MIHGDGGEATYGLVIATGAISLATCAFIKSSLTQPKHKLILRKSEMGILGSLFAQYGELCIASRLGPSAVDAYTPWLCPLSRHLLYFPVYLGA